MLEKKIAFIFVATYRVSPNAVYELGCEEKIPLETIIIRFHNPKVRNHSPKIRLIPDFYEDRG